MKNEQINEATVPKPEHLEFTTNIILLGMIARLYAMVDVETPIVGWGRGSMSSELYEGATLYRVGTGRKILDGREQHVIQMTVEAPGQPQANYYFPAELLRSFTFQLQGYTV